MLSLSYSRSLTFLHSFTRAFCAFDYILLGLLSVLVTHLHLRTCTYLSRRFTVNTLESDCSHRAALQRGSPPLCSDFGDPIPCLGLHDTHTTYTSVSIASAQPITTAPAKLPAAGGTSGEANHHLQQRSASTFLGLDNGSSVCNGLWGRTRPYSQPLTLCVQEMAALLDK